MVMKALRVAAIGALVIAGTVAGLYLTNGAPEVLLPSDAEVAAASKPYVIKMHAQWCPKCRLQKGVWSEVAEAYADRAHFVVFDFTDEGTTAQARATAKRLGLTAVFEEYVGATGFVVVLDRSRGVRAEVGGSEFAVYRDAIEGALSGPSAPGE